MNDYYNVAKETWKNLQNEISDWVVQMGNGQSSVLEPKQALIPNGKIEELLTQNSDISEDQMTCE